MTFATLKQKMSMDVKGLVLQIPTASISAMKLTSTVTLVLGMVSNTDTNRHKIFSNIDEAAQANIGCGLY